MRYLREGFALSDIETGDIVVQFSSVWFCVGGHGVSSEELSEALAFCRLRAKAE